MATIKADPEEVQAGRELLAIRLKMLAHGAEVAEVARRLEMARPKLSEILHGRRPSSRELRHRITVVVLGGDPDDPADNPMCFTDEDRKPVWPVRANSLTWTLEFDEADARGWSVGGQPTPAAGVGAAR